MPFTPNDHRQLAYINMMFLPLFLIIAYLSTAFPSATLLSDSIQDPAQLPYEQKLELLHNHTAAIQSNQTTPRVPKHMVFQSQQFDLFPSMVFVGLLTVAYSALSNSWVAKENGLHVTGTTFDVQNTAADATAVIMDTLFWMFFTVAHAYLFAVLMRITTADNLVLYVFTTLAVLWALTNRILQRYTPALFAAAAFTAYIHTRAVYDITQRDSDLWLPQFILVCVDAIFLIGHTYDEMLSVEVALNCRVAFVFAMASLVAGTTIAQADF